MKRSFLLMALVACSVGPALAQMPRLQVEPLWPRPFPVAKHWILGSVSGVTIDAQDHIWVIHRGVDSLQANEKGPTLEPWASQCCFAAPQVLEFDTSGALLASWDGKGDGHDWPLAPAGIAVDRKGNIWIAGGLPPSNLPARRRRTWRRRRCTRSRRASRRPAAASRR